MAESSADLIVRNARVYTMDGAQEWAAEFAVKGGRFIAVGGAGSTDGLIGPETRTIDAAGRMVMPGLVDVHCHPMMGGRAELFETRFSYAERLDAVIDHIGRAAAGTPEGGWIVGGQWGLDQLPAINTVEALARLDAASGGRPVLLRDESYHNRWLNSEALRRAGITPETAEPEMGSFGRDPTTGVLTGVLIEAASGLAEQALSASGHHTEAKDRAAMARSVATLNGFGVTAFLDAIASQPAMAALKELDRRGALTAWAVCAMPASRPSFETGLTGDELLALRDTFRSAHVRPDFVKIFLDGVPGARTAAFHEPYMPDPAFGCCFRGATMMSVPELIRWLGKCEKLGLSVKIHCAGDAAVSQALDAVEVVRAFEGPTRLTHHIAHASYIAPADIGRFAELGVVADLSPILWYPTPFLEGHKAAMGKERAERFWPNRDLQIAGALMAGGSDWPVVPNPDPWDGIEGLVTRRNPSGAFGGAALWPEQAIDLATALAVYTINSAKALGLGETIGSIEPGKSADFIMLDRNLFDRPADEIADTKVLATFFEGRAIHERS